MDRGGESDIPRDKKRPREEEETANIFAPKVDGLVRGVNKHYKKQTNNNSSAPVNDDVSPRTPIKNGDRTDQVASKEDSRVNMVSVDLCDGEYVLEIKRRKISTDEKVERKKPEQMAQSAGMLFVHAEILRELGDQMLAHYRASLPSIFTIKSSAT